MAQSKFINPNPWTYVPQWGKNRTFRILNENGSIANPEISIISGSRRRWRKRYEKEKKWFTEVKHRRKARF